MSANKEIKLKPVGFVKTKAVGNEIRDKSHVSDIVFQENLGEALDGIKGFSHLFVIFWMHKVSDKAKETKRVHPRGRIEIPSLGVFATRTPYRPNPIGLTLVEILGVERNIVTVRGLDAFDDTPVLDIKPVDYLDLSKDVTVPVWWMKMEHEKPKKGEVIK